MTKQILLVIILMISTALTNQAQNFFKDSLRTGVSGTARIDTASFIHWRLQSAAHYNGKTYISWHDRREPKGWNIISYDHDVGRWGSKTVIAQKPAGDTLHGDHSCNSLTIIPSGVNAGRLLTALGNAGTDGEDVVILKSTSAEDESAWTPIDTIQGTNYTWVDINAVSESKIILFFRAGGARNERWAKSYDGGDTWQADSLFLNFPTYMKTYQSGDSIHCIVSDRVTSSGAFPEYQNIYYLMTPDGGDTWQKADGTSITIPADTTDLDTVFLSSRSPNVETRDSDIIVDDDGNISILIVDDKTSVLGGPAYKRCQFSGSAWVCDSIATTQLLNRVDFLPFGCFDPSDKAGNTVIIPQPGWSGNTLKLERWVYSGGTWSFEKDVANRIGEYNSKSAIRVKDAHEDIRIIYYSSDNFEGLYYSTLGDNTLHLHSWPLDRVNY